MPTDDQYVGTRRTVKRIHKRIIRFNRARLVDKIMPIKSTGVMVHITMPTGLLVHPHSYPCKNETRGPSGKSL